MERSAVINLAHTFLNRVGSWFLTGPSLWEFCCNRDIIANDKITIGIIDSSAERIEMRCQDMGLTVLSTDRHTVTTSLGGIETTITIYSDTTKGKVTCADHDFPKSYVKCNEDTAQEIRKKNSVMGGHGFWRVPLSQTQPLEFNLPFLPGSILDIGWPGWFLNIKHKPVAWGINDVFFDDFRTKNGVELIQKMYECATEAKIDKSLFMGFGTALGAVRHGGFVPSDRDMDACILADEITVEQANKYVQACQDHHLNEYRWKPPQRRSDTNMPLWFSIGPKNPVSDNGVKSCNWFFFNHGGYIWHSKGREWISPAKFNPSKTNYSQADEAIAKGIPSTCIPKLVPMNFLGLTMLVPANLGACLDNWYGGSWCCPKEGASAHNHILVVGRWNDQNTWRVG